MAWKNRQRRVNDSDMIDSEDWNENMREFANEFNGFLDRDNVGEQEIDSSHVGDYAFNRIFDRSTPAEFTLTGSSGRFEGSLVSKQVNLNYNGMLICELSGCFQFSNPLSHQDFYPSLGYQMVTVRLLVDGEEVGRAHSISEFSQRHCFYICGALPVEAGFHKITTEARTVVAENRHGGRQTIASYDGNLRSVSFGLRELVLTYRRR